MRPVAFDAYKLLHEGTLAFARAERQGIRVDVDYCLSTQKHLERQIARLEKNVGDTKFVRHWKHRFGTKFNLNSNFQLSKFLYEVKKMKPPKLTETGQGAVDDETLLQLGISEVDDLLKIRRLRKIKDTYLAGFVEEQTDGVLHPFFDLHTVRTFRSSSSRPNFQNIPYRDKEIARLCRRAVLPRPGHQLLEIDFSGIEVRIAACYHKDSNMLRYLRDPRSDMHLDMAKQIFCLPSMDKSISAHADLRFAAKNGFVFPQFYGDYYGNCARNMACKLGGLPGNGRWKSGQGISMPTSGSLSDHLIENNLFSLAEFTDHVKAIEEDFWNNRFAAYSEWKEKWWASYRKKGFFDMLTGFRCGGVLQRNDVTNYPVQGSAFHCLLWTFVEVDKVARRERWDSALVGQIHDCVLVDAHPAELDHVVDVVERVSTKELPEAWSWIIVPLEVDVEVCGMDAPWSEKKLMVRR